MQGIDVLGSQVTPFSRDGIHSYLDFMSNDATRDRLLGFSMSTIQVPSVQGLCHFLELYPKVTVQVLPKIQAYCDRDVAGSENIAAICQAHIRQQRQLNYVVQAYNFDWIRHNQRILSSDLIYIPESVRRAQKILIGTDC